MFSIDYLKIEKKYDLLILLLLQEHIRVHQGRFRCRICGIIEKSESELAEHKLLHENLDPLDCVLCKKRFKKKGALTRHMRIHVSFLMIFKNSSVSFYETINDFFSGW